MLIFWDTCVNVDDTEIDLQLLTEIDENSWLASDEFMSQQIGCSVYHFNQVHGITNYECCVLAFNPNDLDNPDYGFIYDIDRDIHYLFIKG